MYQHDEKIDKKKIKLISFISFLMGFLQALFIYVISTYFKEVSGTENIGPFYLVSYVVVLIILLNLHKLIKTVGKSNALFFSLLFKIVSLAFMLILPPSPASLVFLMLYIISGSIEWVSLDVVLESFSMDNMSGRIRGKHLTVVNLGFLLGPFLSTKIIASFGYSGIFGVLLVVNALILIIAIIGLRKVNHRFDGEVKVKELIKKVYARKNISRIYLISFALEFFYALAVIYTPIYLLDIGMSWEKIGWIFTAMLIPFVILQYPMGLLADKKIGEKELIIISLVIVAISTLAIYFIGSTSILIWSLVLFSTRIGAAILEIMRDSYFYKRIDGHDIDLINFFRTAQSTAYIVSAVVAFLIFRFFPGGQPIKIIFLAVAATVFLSIYPAVRLKDNPCEAEMNCKK